MNEHSGEPPDLAALRARVVARGCPDGHPPVFGAGALSPRLCIVGEGPAERDERTGRPFSGPAGDLLHRALAEAGVAAGAVWFTNVLKCRLTTEKDGRTVNRPPSAREIAASAPGLEEEIGILNPAVVLGLGASAGKALLGASFAFSRDRGLWFPRLTAPPVLVTYLPAYVLRREGADFDEAYGVLLSDIRRAWAGPG